MKLSKPGLFLATAAMGLGLIACAPKSTTALKIEKGLDDLNASIEANMKDCKKMAAAIQAPTNDIILGIKAAKAANEKLPATTKLKFAGLTTTIQKVGDCAKDPAMEQTLQSIVSSVSVQ
ncbi:MAG: hypothetical protein K8S54_11995 [Spirochaetia bacterium]|nr:hypothetical protein [Spirochaetia bacterium]